MDFKLIALSSLLMLSISAASAQERPQLKNDLENFTLSYCLAQSDFGEILQREAKAAVGAYVERGRYPAEAYEEAVQVVHDYLKRSYKSYTEGVQLTVMKCIDASQGTEIAVIKKRYLQKK
ncbi:T6SS amidase immunity protein Tai4 family protein [Snodgrassella alvi]|uniref:Type VI secretion protein n=1 Tax=Snodgrassella alvi TaxID=1196083 RepID=A0A2N9WWT9_9NEIS|nr:T6SS amidase immunity protein Tai4 family protein [Snodgrassella alvi]PIT12878.1 hypothetical protein BGI33_12330 [Snodgrassella alvi]PIT17197.1 hypothetical protein BGI34_07925 [Snodgrassella alvi]PIT19031.1 hypothetical protein BGI32_00270 [Snodgrassella alvi]